MRTTILLSLVFALAGCGYFNPGGSGAASGPGPVGSGGERGMVEVIIQYPSGQPAREVVEVAGTASVLDVTRRAARVETDLAPNGEQEVVAIGGDKNDSRAGRLWVYEINGLTHSAAPNLKYVTNGDSVRWRYK